MGYCNRCKLTSIKRQAKSARKRVTVVPDQEGTAANVYVSPRDVPRDQVATEKYFAARMLALPEKCVC